MASNHPNTLVQEREPNTFVQELDKIHCGEGSADAVLSVIDRAGNEALAHEDESDRMKGKAKAVEAVVHAMKGFKSGPVCTTGCHWLRIFTVDDDVNDTAFHTEVIAEVLDAMTRFMENPRLQEEGCGTLACISANPKNCMHISELGGIKVLVHSMRRHADAAAVQQQGCIALGRLISSGDMVNVVESGVLDALFQATRNHPSRARVQDEVRRVLSALAESSTPDDGILEKVLSFMLRTPEDSQVQENGCDFLRILAFDLNHKPQIVNNGGVPVVLQSMKGHPAKPAVQHNACGVLCSLAIDEDNQAEILRHGGIEAVLSAIRDHVDDEGVQEQGFGTLQHLACDETSKNLVVHLSGADLVLAGMRKHPSTSRVQQHGCAALRQLASGAAREQIVSLGGIESAIEALRECSSVEAQIEGCAFLREFSVDHGARLAQLGGIRELVEAMRNHPEAERVQEEGCGAIANLSIDRNHGSEISQLEGIELVVEAMQQHPDAPAVQEQGCMALGRLAEHENNSIKLLSLGGVVAVNQAMVKHSDEPGVQQAASRALEVWKAFKSLASPAQQAMAAQVNDDTDASTGQTVPVGFVKRQERIMLLRKSVLQPLDKLEDNQAIFLKEGGQATIEQQIFAGREVAVKKYLVKRNFSEVELQALTEAWLLRQLCSHPEGSQYVVHCHGVKTKQQGDYRDLLIVLELAPQGSLDDVLYADEIQSEYIEARQRGWLQGVAAGLQFLHNFNGGVTHCDLKAANVLLFEDGQMPKLADFGSCKIDKQAQLQNTVSLATLPHGYTPRYNAPEHDENHSLPFTAASDVWSFGVLTYEILYATKVWKSIGDSTRHLSALHNAKLAMRVDAMAGERRQVRDPSLALPGAVAVMEACWARNPLDRPSMHQVVERLQVLREAEKTEQLQQQETVSAMAGIPSSLNLPSSPSLSLRPFTHPVEKKGDEQVYDGTDGQGTREEALKCLGETAGTVGLDVSVGERTKEEKYEEDEDEDGEEDEVNWAQCEKCCKWRNVPPGVEIDDEKSFFCQMLPSVTCDTPEDWGVTRHRRQRTGTSEDWDEEETEWVEDQDTHDSGSGGGRNGVSPHNNGGGNNRGRGANASTNSAGSHGGGKGGFGEGQGSKKRKAVGGGQCGSEASGDALTRVGMSVGAKRNLQGGADSEAGSPPSKRAMAEHFPVQQAGEDPEPGSVIVSTELNVGDEARVVLQEGCRVTFPSGVGESLSTLTTSEGAPTAAMQEAAASKVNRLADGSLTSLLIVGPVINFQPSGARFFPAASLRCPVWEDLLNDLNENEIKFQLGVFTWNEDSKTWEQVEGDCQRVGPVVEVKSASFCYKVVCAWLSRVLWGTTPAKLFALSHVPEGGLRPGVTFRFVLHIAPREQQTHHRAHSEASLAITIPATAQIQIHSTQLCLATEMKSARSFCESFQDNVHIVKTTNRIADIPHEQHFLLRYSPAGEQQEGNVTGFVQVVYDVDGAATDPWIYSFDIRRHQGPASEVAASESAARPTLIQLGSQKVSVMIFCCQDKSRSANFLKEAQDLQNQITQTPGSLDCKIHPLATRETFRNTLRTCRAQNVRIVHLAGHGTDRSGFNFLASESAEDYEPTAIGLMVDMIALEKDTIDFALLNACHTVQMGKQLRKAGVKHVICWQHEVLDGAAAAFARGFYCRLNQDIEPTRQNRSETIPSSVYKKAVDDGKVGLHIWKTDFESVKNSDQTSRGRTGLHITQGKVNILYFLSEAGDEVYCAAPTTIDGGSSDASTNETGPPGAAAPAEGAAAPAEGCI